MCFHRDHKKATPAPPPLAPNKSAAASQGSVSNEELRNKRRKRKNSLRIKRRMALNKPIISKSRDVGINIP